MGLGRFLWRTTGLGRTIDTIKNIVDQESIVDGVKKTIYEDICEDNPITSHIYNKGKYEGKKEGYVEASDEYEEKLLSQADRFLQQKQLFEFQQIEYEKLLDDFEKEIDFLQTKLNRTNEENQYLQQLLHKERKLRNLNQ